MFRVVMRGLNTPVYTDMFQPVFGSAGVAVAVTPVRGGVEVLPRPPPRPQQGRPTPVRGSSALPHRSSPSPASTLASTHSLTSAKF